MMEESLRAFAILPFGARLILIVWGLAALIKLFLVSKDAGESLPGCFGTICVLPYVVVRDLITRYATPKK
jgi:hypothetical protein